MTPHRRIIACVIACAAACGFAPDLPAQTTAPSAHEESFAQDVNLAALSNLAVYTEGRVKSFDSFARQMMHFVSGPRRINGQSPSFTYLDLMLRPERYRDADVVYVKNKEIRWQIARALHDSVREQFESMTSSDGTEPPMKASILAQLDERMKTFMETGLISPSMLHDPRVHELLGRLSTDLLKTAKFIDMIQGALNVMDAEGLRASLRLVAPPGGGIEDRWLTIDELGEPALQSHYEKLDPALRDDITAQWTAFTAAWKDGDAATVNAAAARLASLLPQVNPTVYPQQSRLHWENLYFNWRNFTWVWIIYGFSTIFLLLSVVWRWRPARFIGLSIFTLAFLTHTFAVGLRWYVSGRWPNSNMFEAVTTAAWFGGCLAMLLEVVLRRSPMRNLLALASAAASMCAMMAVHFQPLDLPADINNKMPVLNDIWLYIHTNVIIFSYCLIFMAAVVAFVYLLCRELRPLLNMTIRWRTILSALLVVAVYLVLRSETDLARRMCRVIAGTTMPVAFGLFTIAARARLGDRLGASGFPYISGVDSYARVGGAGSLIMTRPDGSAYLSETPETSRDFSGGQGAEAEARDGRGLTRAARSGTTTFGQVLDGTTMVVMEMSFILLWTGLVMGAIWADHSWGRPWGWDPKEVFALNTFIIFLLLVHVRMKVKDKGLWTALLAVAGAGVMLFNWIIINFAISGLHSYA